MCLLCLVQKARWQINTLQLEIGNKPQEKLEPWVNNFATTLDLKCNLHHPGFVMHQMHVAHQIWILRVFWADEVVFNFVFWTKISQKVFPLPIFTVMNFRIYDGTLWDFDIRQLWIWLPNTPTTPGLMIHTLTPHLIYRSLHVSCCGLEV